MASNKNDYKLIAIASLAFALFSCTQSASSDDDAEVLAKLDGIAVQLDALTARLDTLTTEVEEVQVAVRSEPPGQRPCTIDEIISQVLDGCDPNQLPEDVSVSTTWCIQQGRSGSLGASYKLQAEYELDLGGGWPNVIWGKLTGNVKTPPVIGVGPVAIPLPNEIAAGGAMSLGRGLGICVDVPIRSLEAAEVAQVHALVRGVNDGGKYTRRTGRVLNYAARHTPIAEANLLGVDAGFSKTQFEAGDDSFDIADAAMERLTNGEFTSVTSSGTQIFQDPTFQELAGALELPQPVLDTIADADRIFNATKTIGQSNIATACDDFGISAAVRARFPAIANQCARFGIYPNINATLDFPGRVSNVLNRVNAMYTASGLRNFVCGNVVLSVISSDC